MGGLGELGSLWDVRRTVLSCRVALGERADLQGNITLVLVLGIGAWIGGVALGVAGGLSANGELAVGHHYSGLGRSTVEGIT